MTQPRTWGAGSIPQAEDQKAADLGESAELSSNSFLYTTFRRYLTFCFLKHPALQTDQRFSGVSWVPETMPTCSLSLFSQVSGFSRSPGPFSGLLHSTGSQPLVQNSHDPSRTLTALCFLDPELLLEDPEQVRITFDRRHLLTAAQPTRKPCFLYDWTCRGTPRLGPLKVSEVINDDLLYHSHCLIFIFLVTRWPFYPQISSLFPGRLKDERIKA